jgi:hypothetical protein
MRFSDIESRPNPNAPHAGPVTVGAAAAALTSLVTLHAATQFVLIKVENAALRICPTGTTPTATLGFNYLADTEILLSRNEADVAKLIRAGGTDSAIQVAQYLG